MRIYYTIAQDEDGILTATIQNFTNVTVKAYNLTLLEREIIKTFDKEAEAEQILDEGNIDKNWLWLDYEESDVPMVNIRDYFDTETGKVFHIPKDFKISVRQYGDTENLEILVPVKNTITGYSERKLEGDQSDKTTASIIISNKGELLSFLEQINFVDTAESGLHFININNVGRYAGYRIFRALDGGYDLVHVVRTDHEVENQLRNEITNQLRDVVEATKKEEGVTDETVQPAEVSGTSPEA